MGGLGALEGVWMHKFAGVACDMAVVRNGRCRFRLVHVYIHQAKAGPVHPIPFAQCYSA
jgi:hypothetical protein